MRAAFAAASLLVEATEFFSDGSRNMFAPVATHSGAAQMYRPALAPADYALSERQPSYVYAGPIAYGQPLEYAQEGQSSWTTWACAAAVALVGAAVATRRPGVGSPAPDLEAGPRVSGRFSRSSQKLRAGKAPRMMSASEPAPEPAGPAPTSSGRPSGYPAVWNPQNLEAPILWDLPGMILFEEQFAPEYMESCPPYLTGKLAGDIGFDPWCLVALAKPTKENYESYDKNLRTAEARKEKMLSMSPEEQAESVAWMRNAELKHARLAMLAAAGWPLAELASGSSMRAATGGRAPSLFNGHLLDYWPALLLIFGGLSYLELQTKDRVTDGDFGFDPLGFASGKGPVIDAIPKMAPGYGRIGNMEQLKIAELKNGRAAMMAITGFAVQEFFWGKPVTELTPMFF